MTSSRTISSSTSSAHLLVCLAFFSINCLLHSINGQTQDESLMNVLFIFIDDLRVNIGDPLGYTPNIDAFAEESVSFDFAYTQIPNCNPSRASILTGMRPDHNRVWDLAGQNFRTRGVMRSGYDIVTLPQYFKETGKYWTVSMSKVFHLGDASGSAGRSCPNSGQDLPYSFDKVWKCSGNANLLSPVIFYEVTSNGNRPAGCPDTDESQFTLEANTGCYQSSACRNCVDNVHQCQDTFEATCPADCPDECFIDYLTANASIDFVTEFLDEKLPDPTNDIEKFMIFTGIARPHLPWVVPQRYFDRYDLANDFQNVSLASPRTPPQNMPQWSAGWGYPPGSIEMLNTADSADKGVLYTVEDTAINGETSVGSDYTLTHMEDEYSRRLRAGYYASAAFLDDQIGRIIDDLKARNLYDETIIIITSDHGYSVGELGLWNKHTQFEQDLRVPFFMRVPGMDYSFGKKISTPVELLDIYPTLVELTLGFDINGPTLRQIDGKSLVPLIESLEKDPNQVNVQDDDYYAYSQITRATEGVYPFSSGIMGMTMRTKDWRITQYLDFEDGDSNFDANYNEFVVVHPAYAEWDKVWSTEVYDMRLAPDELNSLEAWNRQEARNLAYDPAYADIVEELKLQLHRTWYTPPAPSMNYKLDKYKYVTLSGYYTTLASPPQDVRDPIVVSTDDSGLYVMGGRYSDGVTHVEAYKYTIASNSWSILGIGNGEGWLYQGVQRVAEVYSGRVFSFGGDHFGGQRMTNHLPDDYNGGEWYEQAEWDKNGDGVNYRVAGACSGIVDSRMYIVGGNWNFNSRGVQNILVEYNILTKTFREVGLLPNSQKTVFCSGVGYNGYLYYFGGTWTTNAAANSRSGAWRFDPNTETWLALQNMPETLKKAGQAVALNNKIIIIGGESSGGVFPTFVRIYDIDTNTWDTTSLPELEYGRAHINPIVIGHDIYLLGGVDFNGELYPVFEKLSIEYTALENPTSQPTAETTPPTSAPTGSPTAPSEEPSQAPTAGPLISPTNAPSFSPTSPPSRGPSEWKPLAEIPVGNTALCAVAVDNNGYYVFGGWQDSNTFFQSIYYYDIALDAWSVYRSNNFWQAKAAFGTAVTYADGDAFYLIGGDNKKSDRYKVMYPYTGGTFSATGDSTQSSYYVYAGAGGVIGNSFFFCGGVERNGPVVDTCFRFNMDTETTQTNPANMPDGGRAFASGVGYGDYLYIFGGRSSEGYFDESLSDSFRYDTNSDTWSSIAPLPVPTASAGQAAVFAGKLVVVGGLICSSSQDCVVSDYVFEYDPDTDTWVYLDQLLTPRYNCAPVVVNDVLYLVAGSTDPTDLFSVSTTHEALAWLDIVPTSSPTNAPSSSPVMAPTGAPTQRPTDVPTDQTYLPTRSPTNYPTRPTEEPSNSPSVVPSNAPTVAPSDSPTDLPTLNPSASPTTAPTSTVSLLKVNCGELQDTLINGEIWRSDVDYYYFQTTQNLNNFIETYNGDIWPDPELHYKSRWSWKKGFYYYFDMNDIDFLGYVSNDATSVTLKVKFYFAQMNSQYFGTDLQIIDIAANGVNIVTGLDVYAQVGSYAELTVERIIQTDPSEVLELFFVPTAGNKPRISAIELTLLLPGDATFFPTAAPTDVPTDAPSGVPTVFPTNSPSQPPTRAPSNAPTPAPTGDFTFLRINCGATEDVVVDGNIWLADDYYTDPNTNRDWTRTYSGLTFDNNQILHETERWSWSKFHGTRYFFDLEQLGSNIYSDYFADEWVVRINFIMSEAQTGSAEVGKRVMDILINDDLIFDNVDIYATVGMYTELVLSAVVRVPRGQELKIQAKKDFKGSNSAKLNAIELQLLLQGTDSEYPTAAPTASPTIAPSLAPTSEPTAAFFAVRINCGSDVTTFSDDGTEFDPDSDFEVTGGGSILSTSTSIASNPSLNQIARTASGLTYTFDLEELQFYRVVFEEMDLRIVLYFAEIDPSITSSGQRLFDVAINGATYLDDFDIFAEAGNSGFTEVTKTLELTVPTDGPLTISFASVVGPGASISAIEVSLVYREFTTLPPSNAPSFSPSAAPTNMPSVPTRAPTSWFPLADSPHELMGMSAVAVNDAGFYILEGYNQFGYRSTTAQYYDIASDTWTNLPETPWYARGGDSAVVSYGNEIFIFGGTGLRAHRMKRYNTVTGVWSMDANSNRLIRNGANLFVAAAAFGIIDNKFIIAGGTNVNSGEPVAWVQYYDVTKSSNSWTRTKALAGGARTQASAAALNNKLYMFGGVTSSGFTADATTDAFVYDADANIWTPIAPLPEPTAYAGNQAVAFVNNKIVIVAGLACTSGVCNLKESVFAYDVSLDNYEYLPHKLTPVHSAATIGIGNVLYACAGKNNDTADPLDFEHITRVLEALELEAAFPSAAPTGAPTYDPTGAPSNAPSSAPSNSPSQPPTKAPSNAPSVAPTSSPTLPTAAPSYVPTFSPTLAPSDAPTNAPSAVPSANPTYSPTVAPTDGPTYSPTGAPSVSPSSAPSNAPTGAPTYTQRSYRIGVVIDDKGGSGTTSPIYMMLIGLERNSQWVVVNDYVDLNVANVRVVFDIVVDDVGNANRVKVALMNQGTDNFRVNQVSVDWRGGGYTFPTADLYYEHGTPDYGRGCGWVVVDMQTLTREVYDINIDLHEWSECPWQPNEAGLTVPLTIDTDDSVVLPSTCGGAEYETYSNFNYGEETLESGDKLQHYAEAVAMDFEDFQYMPHFGQTGLWVLNTVFGEQTSSSQKAFEYFRGEGTIVWTGDNYYTYGGAYPMSTKVYVNVPGTYRVLFRTRTADFGESDLHNDAWLRCLDCARYYGLDEATGQVACPSYNSIGEYGDSKYSCSTDFGPYQGYFKIQKSECACFNWISTLIGVHGVEHQMLFLVDIEEPGSYTFEFAPRSNYFYLDKFVLYMPTSEGGTYDMTRVARFNDYLTPCTEA